MSKKLPQIVADIGALKPDLTTLQEVESELADKLAQCLAGLGLEHHFDSGKGAPENPKWLIEYKKKYGIA